MAPAPSGVGAPKSGSSIGGAATPPEDTAREAEEGAVKTSWKVDPSRPAGSVGSRPGTSMTSRMPSDRSGASAKLHVLPSAARTPVTEPWSQAGKGLLIHAPELSGCHADPVTHAARMARSPP